jgi:acetolactate synthase I/II/III large subunit
MDSRTLAKAAATALADRGSRVIFGLPGGGNNLDLIEAVEAVGIRFILTHTEVAATYMAAAYAEITGAATSCIVTRGPGAASALNGVAHAWLDRQPIVVIADGVSAADSDRISHQHLDQASMFGSITKYSGVLGRTDPGGCVADAISLATQGRPGPVHLMFDPNSRSSEIPATLSSQAPDERALDTARLAIGQSKRAVVVLGGGAVAAAPAIRSLVAGTNIPVLSTYKAKGIIPDSWVNTAGLFTGARMEAPILDASDLILMIGVDSVELIPSDWPYEAPVVALNGWADEYHYYSPIASVVGPVDELVASIPRPLHDGWPEGLGQEHRNRALAALTRYHAPRRGMAPAEIVLQTRAAAVPGSIATVDAGAHMLVAGPLWHTQAPGELIISSGLATMGFALPAAIAAATARPGVRVYCFVGDGGLGMVLAELETLARLDLPVTVVVFNDSRLSLIQLKQNPSGHGGEAAVSYNQSDFASIAGSFGVLGAHVSDQQSFERKLRESNSETGPILLDVQVDPSSYGDIIRVCRGK